MQFILIGHLFVLWRVATAGQIVRRARKKNTEKLKFVKDISAHDIGIVANRPNLVYHWWLTAGFGCHI